MNEVTRNEVVRRWRGGASMRSIARALHLSRNTVRRALADVLAARAGEVPAPAVARPSLLDAYEAVIAELLGRYPDLTPRDRGLLADDIARLGCAAGAVATLAADLYEELRLP